MALVPHSVANSTAAMPAGPRSRLQTGWALALLTLVFAFNQIDRGIVAILLESIKAEMHLSDTMLGLMTGLGFSLVYFCMAFPLARLADRADRIKIISLGVMFYSIMAGLMGLAQNVYQLITFRSLVAVGEASGNGPSSAVLGDLFSQQTRARAIAIWSGGSYLGLFVGLTLGGWIHEHYGWRAALWSISGPGVLVGLLLLFTVPDPRRGAAEPAVQLGDRQSVKATLAFLLSQRSYVLLVIATTLLTFTGYSLQTWVPSFLARVHGMEKAEVGFYAGFFKGMMGLLGIMAGGLLTHHITKKRPNLIGIVPIVSTILIPFTMGYFLLTDNVTHSLAALALTGFLVPAYTAPVLTMLQSVVTHRMRSFAVTILLAAASLGGLGLGPLVVGALSDVLADWAGEDSLRYALIAPALVSFISASLYVRATRFYAADRHRILQGPAVQ